jgi:sporulation protein YlmC with PRC-barrel domain
LVSVLVGVDKLVGKKVITAKAYILSEVKGAEADVDNWRITHLQVKLTDKAATDLGFKKRFRSSTVCMPVTLISAVGEVVTIDKSLDELSRTFDIVECKE